MLYTVVRVIINWWARWYLRLTVIGREYVPASGGLLVASNHVSYLDIPMLGCALGRPADFMGKQELFHHPIIGWIYRRMGGFPIRRGGVTKESLQEAVRRLRSGRVVVIYPEGQINLTGVLLPAKPGIGALVARSGVPVLPAYVMGTELAMPKGQWWIRPRRVTVLLGRPLTFDGEREAGGGESEENGALRERQRARHQEIGRRVMEEINALRMKGLEGRTIARETDHSITQV